MTLERATPKGKVGGGEANGKIKVGPCWRSLIQSELSRGSHKSPDRVRDAKIREHNTDMTETRAARVEQNTRHKAEPSTLYQVYRCINNIRYIVISLQVNMFQQGTTSPCSNKEQTSSSPATNNAIRGTEQSGNTAKQRFARTRWVRGLV